MEYANHGRRGVVLRMREVRSTFMSTRPSPRSDTRNAFSSVFCDTFLFMLMLPNFCEGDHAGGRTPHAYSTRCDMALRVSQAIV
jgi:hypothetical protein